MEKTPKKMNAALLFDWYWQRAGWKWVGIAFLGMMLSNLILFGITSGFSGVNGQPFEPLDLRMGYTHAEAVATLEAIGASGRSWYLVIALGVDMVYPLIYSSFAVFALMGVLKATFVLHRIAPYFKWLFFPFLIWGFDVLENIGIATMIFTFPNIPTWLVGIASVFTLAKWLTLVVYAAVQIIALVTYFTFRNEMKK